MLLKASQFDYQRNWSFFYGASQGSNSMSGVGMILYPSHSKYYKLKLGLGGCTNSRPKLLTLWGLLKFAKFADCGWFQINSGLAWWKF